MTAVRGHGRSADDVPVAYELTGAGWAAARSVEVPETLTTAEAAAWFGLSRGYVGNLAKTGRVDAVQVGRQWLVDAESVAIWVAAPKSVGGRVDRWVPAAPLLRQIELAGGDYAVGVRKSSADKRALERARETGQVTLWMADELAVRLLGMPATMLWSDAELNG